MSTAAEKAEMNKYLAQRGLGQLGDRGLMSQLGYLVRDHSHFRQLLFACQPHLRKQMYDSLSPNLRFTARPLDVYEAEMKDEANRRHLPAIDENGKFVAFEDYIPGGRVNPLDRLAEKAIEKAKSDVICGQCGRVICICGEVPDKPSVEQVAEKAIHDEYAWEKSKKRSLILTCAKCTRVAEFVGATKDAAVLEARRAGWVYQELDGKPQEVCPRCPAARPVKVGNA